MNAEERWLPIVGYEALYEVSDLGRVRRVKAAQGAKVGRIRKPGKHKDGYHLYSLHSGGKRRMFTVHRLVLNAFVGPQPDLFALHFDDNPANNALSNLRWGTRLDNADDWKRNGIRLHPNQNAIKTHCKRGHEFTPENTRIRKGAKGKTQRACRICRRNAQRVPHTRLAD